MDKHKESDSLYTWKSKYLVNGGSSHHEYKLYKRRWLMLAALCLLNFSNGTMWLSFASIPNYTARFYDVSFDAVDWFSSTFFIVCLFAGFISILVLSKCGLRIPLYLGAVFNVVGSLVRYLSTLHPIICSSVPHAGYIVAIIGQVFTACAQPFLLYAPATLAAVWFGTHERALCTGISSVANPVGIAVAQLVSPYVVTAVDRVSMLMWVYTVPAALATVFAIFAFWRSRPALPPAPSAEEHSRPFLKDLKQSLTSWPFLGLLLIWGIVAGQFNALLTLLPQVVCPYGYSDTQSGLWGFLMIICGLVGATIASVVVDYTKCFKEVGVVCMAFATLCFVWFYEVFRLYDQSVLISFSLCFFGFFALPFLPISMELGVELTYPMAEAFSSGLLWSVAQVLGIIIVVSSTFLQSDLPPNLIPKGNCAISGASAASSPNSSSPALICSRNSSSSSLGSYAVPKDPDALILLCIVLTAAMFLYLVVCFRPRYKRLEMERLDSPTTSQVAT